LASYKSKKEAGVKVISPEKSYEDIFIQIHGDGRIGKNLPAKYI
jgi:hypothetical protein